MGREEVVTVVGGGGAVGDKDRSGGGWRERKESDQRESCKESGAGGWVGVWRVIWLNQIKFFFVKSFGIK